MTTEHPAPDPSTAPWPAVRDALRYPLGEAALMTNAALLPFRLLASLLLPVIGVPLHMAMWLWLYGYGLEAMATSGAGRHEPPEGWSLVDPGVHRRHYWLQLLLLLALLAASRLAPEAMQAWLVAGLAVLMPGAVMTLAMAQNLPAALNPLNWLRIAGTLGASYLWLALAAWGVLWLQARGGELFEGQPLRLLAITLYYLIAQHFTLSLFRLMGLAWHAHAETFDSRQASLPQRPGVQERHETELLADAQRSGGESDPTKRAAQLALLLLRGAPDELHREYRRCLRATSDLAALDAHARVRVCELLALANPRSAVALANEALTDASDFALPDGAATGALMHAAEQLGLHRQAAQWGSNYRQSFPRRYDGLPLALHAAVLYADQLEQPELAGALLRAALPMTEAGIDREAFDQMIDRLQQGHPLADPPH